jgi:hypothetical protein
LARILIRSAIALWRVALALAIAWCAAALWIDGPAARPLAGALAAGAALLPVTVFALLRPRWKGDAVALAVFAGVLAWWLAIEPRNDRDWQPDVAQPPRAELRGEQLRFRNLRNFDYRSETDYAARWEERSFDLSRLRGLDLSIVYWGSPYIAHTILSWDFEGGLPLAISIETRKERGEGYSALRGFFRQFELYYVVSDERDVVRVRTHHRGEQVYLYRLRTPPERARALLLDYVATINRVADRPVFYNALTDNCTTAILLHANHAIEKVPLNWKWIANGFLDEWLYEHGVISRVLPFAVLKQASHINARARAAGDGADFSARIREGLPARPAWTEVSQ